MGTVLNFDISQRRDRRGDAGDRPTPASARIVIFPGVRIERHEVDLGHRIVDSAGSAFDGIGDNGRPRKSS